MMRSLIAEQVVQDPAGREWTVGVCRVPRRPTWLGWGPGRRSGKETRKDPSDWSLLDYADPGCMPDDFPILGAITRRRPVVGFRSSKETVAEVSWSLRNGRDVEGM